MTIQQILTEGQGLVLNNIEIQDDYGVKAGKTPHRAMLITDSAGGKTILKIWGPGSAQTFHKGETISLQAAGEQGSIKANEYPAGSGKFTLNANSCEIVRGDAPAGSAPHAARHRQLPLQPLRGHPRASRGNSSPQMSWPTHKQLISLVSVSVSRALAKILRHLPPML